MADPTPKEIFETKIADGLKADPGRAKAINAVYQFNVTGPNGGTWTVDLRAASPGVKSGAAEKANCTITVADTDFINLVTGKANGQTLFMSGKIKIAGDMGLAMKLTQVLK